MALCLNNTRNIFTSPTPWLYQAAPKPYEQSRFLTSLTFLLIYYCMIICKCINCTLYKTFVRRVCFIFIFFAKISQFLCISGQAMVHVQVHHT